MQCFYQLHIYALPCAQWLIQVGPLDAMQCENYSLDIKNCIEKEVYYCAAKANFYLLRVVALNENHVGDTACRFSTSSYHRRIGMWRRYKTN